MKSKIFNRSVMIAMALSLTSPSSAIAGEAGEIAKVLKEGAKQVGEKVFHHYLKDCVGDTDACLRQAPPGRLPNLSPAEIEAFKRSNVEKQEGTAD